MNKILITEGQVKRLIKLVLEQESDDWEHFYSLDYVHAFIKVFKNWIESTKQVNFSDFPFSYLIAKYGQEFAKKHKLIQDDEDYEDEDEDEDLEYRYDTRTLERWGRELIKLGLIKYPTLREEGSFMNRFGKAIDKFIALKKYPDYMNVKIEEPKNFVLQPVIHIDIESALKSDSPKTFSKWDFNRDLEEYVKNILGIGIGSPVMGKVKFEYPNVHTNKDTFTKEVINKVIKKEIRQLPYANHIKAIRVEITDQPNVVLKMIFKDYPEYQKRAALRDGTKEIIKNLGYNPNKFRVEI